MKYTSNYNLKKPEPSVDYYDKENDNFNMDAIDGVLKEHADGISAIESELTKVSQTIVLDKDGQSKVATDSQDSPARIVELGGVTMYNAIMNINPTLTYTPSGEGNAIKFYKNGQPEVNSGYSTSFQGLHVSSGDKIYISVTTTEATLLNGLVGIQHSDSTEDINTISPVSGTTKYVSGIVTATKTGFAIPFVADNNSGIVAVTGIVCAFAINLSGTPQALFTTSQLSRIVGEYFEGQKSQTKVSVLSRGTNIFSKHDALARPRGYLSTLGINTPSDLYYNSIIHVTGGQTYSIANNVSSNTFWFDSIGNTNLGTFASTGGVAPPNAKLLGITLVVANINTAQVNKGTTLLPYEEYQGQELTIESTDLEKFEFSQVPNGTKNTYEVAENGEEACWKRNETRLIESTDITFAGTGVNIDIHFIERPFAKLGNPTVITGQTNLGSSKEILLADFDNMFQIGNYYDGDSDTKLRLVVPKGQSVATTQAQYVGKLITYQLATPIKVEPKDSPAYGIVKTGSIASNSDYTEFIQHSADLYSDVKIQYSATLAQSMEDIKTTLYSHQIMLDAKANKKQENWFDPTLLNGWSNYGGVYSNVSYFKDDIGFVHLRGSIVGGINTQGTTLFILPADCRIGINNYGIFPVISSNALGSIQIYSDGRVVIYAGTSTIISLDGISFRAEG